MISDAAWSLKTNLRKLWADHVIWTREYLVAAIAATQQLQEEGVQKFIDSFHTLFECIDNKRTVLQQQRGV